MSTHVFSHASYVADETDRGDAFSYAVLASLLLLALPVKNSAYLIPPLFIGMQALAGNIGFIKRTSFWLYVAVFVSAASITIDSLYGRQVNGPGLLVSLITFAQVAVILGLRPDFEISSDNWRRIKAAVACFVIVQSTLGLLQYLASHEPDAVCGTLGLFDFRGESFGMSQACLTFNLFAMIMFLLTDIRGILAKIAVVAGLLACTVAHSGHQTVFAIISLAFVAVTGLRMVQFIKLAIAFVLMLAVTATISSVYLSDVEYWGEKVTQDDNSPKKVVTLSALQILSSPKNLLLGVGMGQFGSRAALITSDDYLPIRLPSMLVGKSRYFSDNIDPAIELFREQDEGSVMSKPYSSGLNFIVEFGLPLTLLMLVAIVIQFVKNRRLSRSRDKHIQAVGVFSNVGLMFLVLCCFIELYLELPQAIFLPSLLYLAVHARLNTDANWWREPAPRMRIQR